MKAPLFYCVSDEIKNKLFNNKAPKWDFKGVNYRHNWESLGEIGKIIRKPPHRPKRGKKW